MAELPSQDQPKGPDAWDLLRADLGFNNRDFESAVRPLARRAVLKEVSSKVPAIVGRAKIAAGLADFVKAFPDAKTQAYRVIEGEGWILVESLLTGTQGAPVGAMRSRGKRIAVRGARLHRIEGGEIVETRVYMDAPTVLRQLGRIRGRPHWPKAEGAKEPHVARSAPDPELEKRFKAFVEAWYGPKEKRVDRLIDRNIAFRLHSAQEEGQGIHRFIEISRPIRMGLERANVEVKRSFSAGPWVVAELLRTGETRKRAAADGEGLKIRLSQLVVARFADGRVVELDTYANTLGVLQTIYGDDLGPLAVAEP
jgi:ketosteroid isomerase-like protein